jgi:threonine aldolase
VPPKAITWQAGVDAMSFGATKNGASLGEAVVFFDRELAREFEYRCKQAGQLASKMRFLSAGWIGLLRDGVWLRNARHANTMAALLEQRLAALGVEFTFPRQANALFTKLTPAVIERLHQGGWHFYTFIAQGGARLMCSWDTREEDVEAFAAEVKEALGR